MHGACELLGEEEQTIFSKEEENLLENGRHFYSGSKGEDEEFDPLWEDKLVSSYVQAKHICNC